MSVKDVVTSLLTEVKGPDTARTRKEPAAGVDDGSLAAGKTPKPNEPDPEQVQYPGYFKDGGSL
ncbi:hypothetical protein [Pararhizobium sp. O133]|uniref:hypothetical protein n=1 Tax=Pararhizobium sp. O133 TaxID=3449278 RepID=UPI003F68808A